MLLIDNVILCNPDNIDVAQGCGAFSEMPLDFWAQSCLESEWRCFSRCKAIEDQQSDPPIDSLNDLWTLLHFMCPTKGAMFNGPSQSRLGSSCSPDFLHRERTSYCVLFVIDAGGTAWSTNGV